MKNQESKKIEEQFEFRSVRTEETDEAAALEQKCFPPNEACAPQFMKERIQAAAEIFLVAVDRGNGRIAGFLNGIATEEKHLRDEVFTDASLHDPRGKKYYADRSCRASGLSGTGSCKRTGGALCPKGKAEGP